MIYPSSFIKSLPKFSDLLGPIDNFIVKYPYSQIEEVPIPNLCNGYIGLDIETCWLFLDGIYNGERTESHRAAIPSPVCWFPVADVAEEPETIVLFHFGMGIHVFIQRYSNFDLYTTTFVSRARPNLLVRSVEAVFRDNGPYEIRFKPGTKVDWTSPDMQTSVEEINNLLHFEGKVFTMESSEIHPQKDCVFAVTEINREFNDNGAILSRANPHVTYLTTLSRISRCKALEAFEQALEVHTGSPTGLLDEHAEAWLCRWSTGRILLNTAPIHTDEIECGSWELHERHVGEDLPPSDGDNGEDEDEGVFSLPRCLISAQYALLSNFPDYAIDYLVMPSLEDPIRTVECAFFGVSPTGLGRGNTEDDYMGHVFWDMDVWMLPYMSLLHPSLSRSALDYRHATLASAQLRSKREGLCGARFAWESARTGLETSPWNLSATREIHVVANVSLAIQQWLTLNVTQGGRLWYEARGQRLLNAIAAFWASRVDYCSEKCAYVIRDVMPPDEYCHNCDNSAYTNAAAMLALSGPARMARMFGKNPSADQAAWENMAQSIWMPFDPLERVMLEYEGYRAGTTVKQADTVLLSYPLQYDQSKDDKIRMISKYAKVISRRGPAMTWAMFFISAMEVDLMDEAAKYFDKCLRFCKPPFYVWDEVLEGDGARNFITGLGGFLQAILNGIFGIRIRAVKTENGEVPALQFRPKIVKTYEDVDKKRRKSGKSHSKHNLHQNLADQLSHSVISVYGVAFLDRRLNFTLDPMAHKLKIVLASGEPLSLTEVGDKVYEGTLRGTTELPLSTAAPSTFYLKG